MEANALDCEEASEEAGEARPVCAESGRLLFVEFARTGSEREFSRVDSSASSTAESDQACAVEERVCEDFGKRTSATD